MSGAVSLGRIVTYRSKTGNYDLAAIVTGTVASVSPAGIEAGEVRPLTDESHVHLQVFTPGKARHYQEFDVPRDDGAADDERIPGAWRWPERV